VMLAALIPEIAFAHSGGGFMELFSLLGLIPIILLFWLFLIISKLPPSVSLFGVQSSRKLLYRINIGLLGIFFIAIPLTGDNGVFLYVIAGFITVVYFITLITNRT